MAKREPGFYWVRFHCEDEWKIAKWTEDGTFDLIGDTFAWEENAFAEIDERQIKRLTE